MRERSSGDGESEKTACVVNSLEEKNHVLVHRYLQLPGRQTEVRGADGHFYDAVTASDVQFIFSGGGHMRKSISM